MLRECSECIGISVEHALCLGHTAVCDLAVDLCDAGDLPVKRLLARADQMCAADLVFVISTHDLIVLYIGQCHAILRYCIDRLISSCSSAS